MQRSCRSAWIWGTLALASACGTAAPLFAESPKHPKNLKFDVVHLKSGRTPQGMLIKETPKEVTLQLIYLNPGEPIRIEDTGSYPREKIDHIDRLAVEEREKLTKYLAHKLAEREKFKQRLETLELKPAPWAKASTGGLSHRSDHFLLISNAREDIVRRAAVRLEQIYAAYEDFLPPRRAAGRPTTILLIQSLAEYRETLKQQGRSFSNPAFYDTARNEIVCASDLERLGEELERVKKEHKKLLAQLASLERDMVQKLGKVPEDKQKEFRALRQKIQKENVDNDKKFEEATDRLFQTLYHEAFHAYLASFVYPPVEAEVPRWLNEGLAQIFETPRLDGCELFVGKPDKRRVERVQRALAEDEFLPLSDLLRAGSEKFLVSHGGDQEVSDRYYLASWSLAYYLAIERKKLGTPELDKYVTSVKKLGTDPQAAFTELVGQPLVEFEKAFRQYLRKLPFNASTAKG